MPLLSRAQWQSQESRSLLDRVFGGRVAPLLTHFSQHEKLSAKDVAELRKLLDSIEQKER
jgi:BlaI family transcriptional regulator, penicillinase repressor